MEAFSRTLQIVLLTLTLCVALAGVVAQDAIAASSSPFVRHGSPD